MSMSAAYLVRSPEEPRENMDWVPESSRRARGFAVYAAVRELGRQGVAETDRALLPACPPDGRSAARGPGHHHSQ